MKVKLKRNDLYPVIEIEDVDNPTEVATYMCHGILPEKMSLEFNGATYHFATANERIQWALGFQASWEFRQ